MAIEPRPYGVDVDSLGEEVARFVDPLSGHFQVVFLDDPEESWSVEIGATVLRKAVDAGLGLIVENYVKRPDGFSLQFLEPIIEDLTWLRLYSVCTLKDMSVLERANSLTGLQLTKPRSRERPDLSQLPALEHYIGTTHACMRSVFANPNLSRIIIDGPPPPGGLEVAGRVKRLEIWSASKWVDPPRFLQREAPQELRVTLMKDVDFEKFSSYSGLRTLELQECKNLRSLSALVDLPALDSFIAVDVTSDEDWSQILPMRASIVSVASEPSPPREVIDAAAVRGWRFWSDDDTVDEDLVGREGCVELREYPDEEGTFLQVTRFLDVTDAFEREKLGEPNGHSLEARVKKIVASLEPPIAASDIEYDSETDMMDVIFKHRDDAFRVAELLANWIYRAGASL